MHRAEAAPPLSWLTRSPPRRSHRPLFEVPRELSPWQNSLLTPDKREDIPADVERTVLVQSDGVNRAAQHRRCQSVVSPDAAGALNGIDLSREYVRDAHAFRGKARAEREVFRSAGRTC